jgi:hypothetical protein
MFRKTNKITINKNKNDKFHGRFVLLGFVFLNIISVEKKEKFLQMEIFKCTLSKVEIVRVLHNLYIYIDTI